MKEVRLEVNLDVSTAFKTELVVNLVKWALGRGVLTRVFAVQSVLVVGGALVDVMEVAQKNL